MLEDLEIILSEIRCLAYLAGVSRSIDVEMETMEVVIMKAPTTNGADV